MKKLLSACIVALTPFINCPAHGAQTDVVRSAQQLMDRGNTDMALAMVDKAVVANPDDRAARLMRGVILAKTGRTNEAIDAFSAFARDYPNLPEGHNNLAVLYSNMGDYDKARIELESVIRVNPNYAPGWSNLAEVYLIMAGQSFSKSLQMDKQNSQMAAKIALIKDMSGKAAAMPAKAPPMITAQNCPAGNSNEPLTAGVAAGDKPMRFEVMRTLPAESSSGLIAEQTKDSVIAAVKRWASLWSQKAFREYIAMYAPDFHLPEGMSRQQWEKQRAARIRKDEKILVEVGPFTNVEMEEGGRVVAIFRQHYKSGIIDDTAEKRLTLVKLGGEWKIQNEELVESAATKSS